MRIYTHQSEKTRFWNCDLDSNSSETAFREVKATCEGSSLPQGSRAGLNSFFVEHLENKCRQDPRLAHYFGEGHPAGLCFKAMLAYRKLKDFREGRFRELADRIIGIVLKKDEVIQPREVINTLRGDDRSIPIQVHTLDFGYTYSHISPFPIRQYSEQEVDAAFEQVFELAARFFSS